MKKILLSIVIVFFILAMGFAVSIPIVNDICAMQVKNTLLGIPLPDDAVIVDSLSKAGKLIGNGNGMQYFGALLIKSGMPQEELAAYYSSYNSGIRIERQNARDIEVIEIGYLAFDNEISGKDYYIVYLFGSGSKLFGDLDLRGH